MAKIICPICGRVSKTKAHPFVCVRYIDGTDHEPAVCKFPGEKSFVWRGLYVSSDNLLDLEGTVISIRNKRGDVLSKVIDVNGKIFAVINHIDGHTYSKPVPSIIHGLRFIWKETKEMVGAK